MNSIIPVTENRITNPTLDNEGGFSASLLRKTLVAANPDWTKKQIREAVNTQLKGEQQIALANTNEAVRRGYTFLKQTISKSGRMHITLTPPSKASNRKVALSTLSIEEIEAELMRRRSVAVA
jgi:hypothetical protein